MLKEEIISYVNEKSGALKHRAYAHFGISDDGYLSQFINDIVDGKISEKMTFLDRHPPGCARRSIDGFFEALFTATVNAFDDYFMPRN